MSPTQPAVLDTLLAEREWVRSLARSLVLDRDEADDLEQDAWVAALERPPAGSGSPRGWLATVLRRGRGRARRGEARIERRERVAARPEGVMSTADVVALAEQHRRVVGHVLALDEPYRGTVLARYFEGLPPRAIAARSGDPVKTVASRLARGLEQLRARLDAESKGDRRAWVAALMPLAGLDDGVSLPTSGGGAGVTAGVVGGVAMSTKAKALALAVVLLLAGTATWWVVRADPGISSQSSSRDSVETAAQPAPSLAVGATAPRPASAAARKNPVDTKTSAGARPGAKAAFEILVGERVDGMLRPIDSVQFYGRDQDGEEFGGRTTRGLGTVPTLDGRPPNEIWVWAEGFALRRVVTTSLPADGSPLEIELERGRAVELRFVDAVTGDALAPDAVRPRYADEGLRQVVVVPPDQSQVHAVKDMVRRTVAPSVAWQWEGEIEFRDGIARISASLKGDAALVLVRRPGDEPYLATVRDLGGDRLVADVPLRTSVPTARVRCVAAEDGRPIGGAVVFPYAEAGDDALFVAGSAPVVADASGEAELPLPGTPPPGMRPPTWWAFAPDRAAMIPSGQLVSAKGATVIVALVKTATIRGHAYLRSGAPAAGKTVLVGKKGNYQTAIVAADGAFALRGVADPDASGAPSTVKLILVEDVDGLVMSFQSVRIEPGRSAEAQIGSPKANTPTGRIRGRVTAGGRPLAGLLVAAGSESGARGMSSTDADGRYLIEGLAPGDTPFAMALGDPGVSDDSGLRADKPVRVDAGADATLDFDLPAGALRVSVVDDRTGKPVGNAAVIVLAESDDVERDRFPGFAFRPGWSALADENGVVVAHALPIGAPLLVHAITKDRGLKARVTGIVAGDAASPPTVVVRVKAGEAR